MRLNCRYLIPVMAAAAVITGCAPNGHSGKSPEPATGDVAPPTPVPEKVTPAPMNDKPIAGAATAMMPKALLYKTTGDYLDNVPVQLNPDGSLLSFPSPADIPASARPVVLANGWILNPMGVTNRTVFTRYTLDEYRRLPQPPAPEEILKAVIPGSKVLMTIQAPMTLGEALADTAAVNRFLTPQPRK